MPVTCWRATGENLSVNEVVTEEYDLVTDLRPCFAPSQSASVHLVCERRPARSTSSYFIMMSSLCIHNRCPDMAHI